MHNLSTVRLEPILRQLPASNYGLGCESLDKINEHQLYAGIVNVTEKVALTFPILPGYSPLKMFEHCGFFTATTVF
jgi:hypothetical protein